MGVPKPVDLLAHTFWIAPWIAIQDQHYDK